MYILKERIFNRNIFYICKYLFFSKMCANVHIFLLIQNLTVVKSLKFYSQNPKSNPDSYRD